MGLKQEKCQQTITIPTELLKRHQVSLIEIITAVLLMEARKVFVLEN
jgi:hypothetical protein